MLSKKRLTLLGAAAASAALFATLVPGSASAEINRRLCGAKLANPAGVGMAYAVAKVSKGDTSACDEAIDNKAPDLLVQTIRDKTVPDPDNTNVTSNVRMATCEDVYKDLGWQPGTDHCPDLKVSPDPGNVTVTLITRAP